MGTKLRWGQCVTIQTLPIKLAIHEMLGIRKRASRDEGSRLHPPVIKLDGLAFCLSVTPRRGSWQYHVMAVAISHRLRNSAQTKFPTRT